jgi:hypothetical protein
MVLLQCSLCAVWVPVFAGNIASFGVIWMMQDVSLKCWYLPTRLHGAIIHNSLSSKPQMLCSVSTVVKDSGIKACDTVRWQTLGGYSVLFTMASYSKGLVGSLVPLWGPQISWDCGLTGWLLGSLVDGTSSSPPPPTPYIYLFYKSWGPVSSIHATIMECRCWSLLDFYYELVLGIDL